MNRQITTDISEIYQSYLRKEFIKQGHNLTSKFIDSIEYKIVLDDSDYWIEFSYLYYGEIVRKGVKASKIPYSGRRKGSKKTSKYIQGLIAFAKKRGFTNPKGAAFAIAAKHKREGMPTQSSRKFSATGRRTLFVEDAVKEAEPQVLQLLNNKLGDLFEQMLLDMFVEHQLT